jgi:hypothetical protein
MTSILPTGFNRRDDDAGDEPRGLFDIEPDSKDRDPQAWVDRLAVLGLLHRVCDTARREPRPNPRWSPGARPRCQ